MQYLDGIIGQVVTWAVALVLAWIAAKFGAVKKFTEDKPFLAAVIVATLISGVLSLLTRTYTDGRVVALAQNLESWGGNGESEKAAKCPEGMYAVGISVKSVPGGRAGFLENAHLVCRPLNAEF